MKKENYDYYFTEEIISILTINNLIFKEYESDDRLRLNNNGIKAEQIGIENYLSSIEADRKLDSKIKVSNLTSNKTTKTLSIIAIICSILVPISVEIISNKMETSIQESYYNGSNRQQIVDSIIGFILSDSVLIEKAKYSIKHDTLFLNELKNEIIEMETKK